MLAIYKYNLFKYVKAPSTWVIIGIACFISGFLGGYLPYSSLNTNSDTAAEVYSKTIVSIVAGMSTFLSLFVSVFAGFKAATMFKDEVEDGTFLVTLSKPITRGKIVFGKWLALQTFLLLFSFLAALFYGSFTYAFDTGYKITGLSKFGVETIKENIWSVSLTLWALITLMGLIFSSVALLVSTKFSVGTTIGISIAIGVIIPITSLLTTFTKKEEFSKIDGAEAPIVETRFNRFENAIQRYGSSVDVSLLHKYTEELQHEIESPESIYSLGFSTGEKDDFSKSWFASLDFQIHKLAEYASESVVPQSIKESIAGTMQGLGNFGAEGVSNKQDDRNMISHANNDDYQYIINYLSKHFRFLAKYYPVKIHTVWAVFKDFADKGLLAMPNNDKVPAEHASQVLKLFPVASSVDLSQLASLEQILNDDWSQADPTTHITPLGYDINVDTKPSGESIKQEWWVNWYKLSHEIIKNREANLNNPNYKDEVSFVTYINAMDSLLSDSNNLAGRKMTWNDYLGKTLSTGRTKINSAYGHVSLSVLYESWPRSLVAHRREDAAQAMSSLAILLQDSVRPVGGLLVNYAKLKKFTDKHGVTALPDNKATHDRVAQELGADYSFSDGDRKALYLLLGMAEQKPELLFKIKTTGYVNKRTILLVYLSIALFLVPVSYWIVRRKDFR